MAWNVAIHRSSRGFLRETPANPARGCESGDGLTTYTKLDFADQAAVNSYVTARGGVAADWVFVSIPI